ncbi:unnamed protein product [Lactuca saligna]|uniref:Transmembrane protein n=1 Tax=Lactuca saligna TaxID=75948 RepID=A0AA36EL87_LACSI|nr:unnamed protein product [Lactuca saligna]
MANNRLFHFFAPKHHHIFNSHRLIFYRSVGDSGSIPRQRHFVRSSFQSTSTGKFIMWNPIGALFSGVGHVFGSIFGAPLDFLSGKSCNSLCGPTWDFACYIENFCIQHLIKLCAVSLLVFVVLLFFYFLYKIGIYHCIFHMLWKLVRACIWRRRKRDIEMTDMSINGSDEETDMETSFSYRNNGRRRLSSRDHKRNHFRRSLRPKSHRLRVGVDGDSVYATKRKRIKHGDVQVVKTSSFARKGTNHKRSRRK